MNFVEPVMAKFAEFTFHARTRVNKGKKKDRSFYAPALRARSLRLPWRRESSSLHSST
jgi:hypothetical protein